MKKPPEALLKLIDLGAIRGIIIEYRQTGNDTAETFCEILGSGTNKVGGLWRTYKPFLDVKVEWATVARVHATYIKDAAEWEKFESENAKELAEYNRLKQKFEA
jgi:hypothetical protein